MGFICTFIAPSKGDINTGGIGPAPSLKLIVVPGVPISDKVKPPGEPFERNPGGSVLSLISILPEIELKYAADKLPSKKFVPPGR